MTGMPALLPTAFHTTGPFFPPDFLQPGDNDLTWLHEPGRCAAGERIRLSGRLTEQGGVPRTNAVLEIWQADAQGRFNHPLDPHAGQADPDFAGWGRTATDGDGRFSFLTVRPGPFDDPYAGIRRAPHINIQILSSGLMRRLVTAIWFADPGSALPDDPVLAAVPPGRRERLLARPERMGTDAPAGTSCYWIELALQGEAETPFFVD